MKCFKVVNESGLSASRSDFEDLALYPTRKQARRYIEFLQTECGINEKFTIIPLSCIVAYDGDSLTIVPQ